MLSPEQYLHDAGTQYRPESDLIIGIPVAAHQEGNPRILRTVRMILELSNQSLARDPALFLYLNYPPESAPPAENIRELDDQLGSLALGSRTAVIPLIDPRGADATIGAIRKRLWDTTLETYPGSSVCISTDIDMVNFSAGRLYDGNPFDLILEGFNSTNIDAALGRYETGGFIEDIEQICGLSGREKLELNLINTILRLSPCRISSLLAEANCTFTSGSYRSVGGVNPGLSGGEMLDLRSRISSRMTGSSNPVASLPVLLTTSPRRKAWRMSSGWYGGEWEGLTEPFSQHDKYRSDANLKALYLDLARTANAHPLEFISAVLGSLDISASLGFTDFSNLADDAGIDDSERTQLFLTYKQILPSCLLGWLLRSDLDNHRDIEYHDKLSILKKFLPIGEEEAVGIIDKTRVAQSSRNHEYLDNSYLSGLYGRIIERTLARLGVTVPKPIP